MESTQGQEQPPSPSSAWYVIRKGARDLGLPADHPHDFHHWRATQVLRQGVPINQVQGYLHIIAQFAQHSSMPGRPIEQSTTRERGHIQFEVELRCRSLTRPNL
jgi:integrase